MPLIDVSLAPGRSPEELREFIAALHEVAEQKLGAVPENTTVILREVPAELWSRANVTVAERRAQQA